jgi:hypothetical protein
VGLAPVKDSELAAAIGLGGRDRRDCKTVEQMRLVNAVCRFVELAQR